MATNRHPDKRHREAHLAQVAARYVRGQLNMDIARELDVSPSQITYDLKILTKRWRDSALVDFDTAKAIQLEKLDEIERTAWAAWEQSRADFEETMTSSSQGPSVTARAMVKKRKRSGNPDYLEIMLRCVEQRCKIFGLYAPTTVAGHMDHGVSLAFLQALANDVDDEGNIIDVPPPAIAP